MKIFKIKKNIGIKIKKMFINQNGQSTVEFILLIPFLIITCITVFQLGYVIYLKNNVKQMSREAARVVSTTNSNSLGEQAIKRKSSLSDDLNFNIDIEPKSENERKTADVVSVGISINYDGFGGLITKMFGKSLLIYSESSMRMECE